MQGLAAMCAEHADEKRSLPDWHPTEAVDEKDGGNGMRRVQLGEVAFEVAARHRFVGFVFEAGERLASLEFADDALELHARADLARGECGGWDDDGFVSEVDLDWHDLASGDGWDDGEFARVADGRVPRGVFLIDGDAHLIERDGGSESPDDRSRSVVRRALDDAFAKAELIVRLGEGEDGDVHVGIEASLRVSARFH